MSTDQKDHRFVQHGLAVLFSQPEELYSELSYCERESVCHLELEFSIIAPIAASATPAQKHVNRYIQLSRTKNRIVTETTIEVHNLQIIFFQVF